MKRIVDEINRYYLQNPVSELEGEGEGEGERYPDCQSHPQPHPHFSSSASPSTSPTPPSPCFLIKNSDFRYKKSREPKG